MFYSCQKRLDFKQLVYYTSFMDTKRKSIGSFDAKTHLAQLIEKVQSGHEFIITKRGKPVARLVPYKDHKDSTSMAAIISQFDEIRHSVKGTVDIRQYIDEGRKR
jgi:prevent-host-death family protein